MKSNGLLQGDSFDKTNILNQHFKDAFSTEDEFTSSQHKQRCKVAGNIFVKNKKIYIMLS